MRRATGFGVGLASVGLALLVGCGPEKKLPDKEPPVVDPGPPAIPTESQPEAREVVEHAVQALTDGHPERLEKAKVNRLVLEGLVRFPVPMTDQTVMAKTIRRLAGVWPDRLRFEQETPSEKPRLVLSGYRPAGFWLLAASDEGRPEPIPLGNPQQQEEILRVDGVGQYWFYLLVPLIDPKTVVFEARTTRLPDPAGKDIEVEGIKVAVPNHPVFTLWFDRKTHLLARIQYPHSERGSPIRKMITIASHKPSAGLILPAVVRFDRNEFTVEEWNALSWEFPERLDESVFDPPK